MLWAPCCSTTPLALRCCAAVLLDYSASTAFASVAANTIPLPSISHLSAENWTNLPPDSYLPNLHYWLTSPQPSTLLWCLFFLSLFLSLLVLFRAFPPILYASYRYSLRFIFNYVTESVSMCTWIEVCLDARGVWFPWNWRYIGLLDACCLCWEPISVP